MFTRGYFPVGSEKAEIAVILFFQHLFEHLPIPGPEDTAVNNPESTGCMRAQVPGLCSVRCRVPCQAEWALKFVSNERVTKWLMHYPCINQLRGGEE